MPRIRRFWLFSGFLLTCHATASVAWAQRSVTLPEEESTWLRWVIALGLGVIICISGFINAKRSHLT